MKRNYIIIGIMTVVLAVMIWQGVKQSRGGGSVAAANLSGDVRGKGAPDFELTDVRTGKPVRLSDYRGKAVLLNFWATWCPPCKEEIPLFIYLQKQYEAQGLVILGVAMDDSGPNAIASFAEQARMNYPVLLGTDAVADQYGNVEALPTTFYIGRDGRIVNRIFGLVSQDTVEANIKAALRQGNARVAALESLDRAVAR
jgi:thiol-disulfide isomerase/thioredoxin